MGFMDNLANSSSNTSSIFGQPAQQNDSDVLSIVNRLKDREMQDFKDKANYMSDLSLRQEQRMRTLYDPEKHKNPNSTQGMNFVTAQNPQMTEYQRGELGVRNKENDLESQKINQQGKLGQEAIDVKTQQEKLNQQKSDQINILKEQDMQRKMDEANKKIELATQALQDKTANQQQILEAHKAMADAVEERHKLEMAQKDKQFEETKTQHQKQIDALEERLKQGQNTKTTTELDPNGNKKTVTTQRGDAAINAPTRNADGTYTVIGPNGVKGTIPADKLDDWLKNHQPGGGDQ